MREAKRRPMRWSDFFKRLRGAYRVTTLGSMQKRQPFRVLISTVISQRTKDETTARVSAALFSRYPTAKRLAAAPESELRKILKSSGFYRQKSERVKEIARIVSENLRGRVPRTMEELTRLPGVGRKTAACVINYGFGEPAIAVDTHVHRISNRLGLVRTKTPEQTEAALMQLVPKRYWVELNDLLVSHGKATCRPRRPLCGDCSIARYCLRRGVSVHM